MILTKEQALEFHWQMWGDMQNILGDCPWIDDREDYKQEWCRNHFPSEHISCHCFLCEYADQFDDYFCTTNCPIDWSNGGEDEDSCTRGHFTYGESPISDILALPVRRGRDYGTN